MPFSCYLNTFSIQDHQYDLTDLKHKLPIPYFDSTFATLYYFNMDIEDYFHDLLELITLINGLNNMLQVGFHQDLLHNKNSIRNVNVLSLNDPINKHSF